MIDKIEKKAIDTLKISGIAAINRANSGHPGIVLGAATMMHTLYTRHLNYDPTNINWVNRDRFIMSAGHGSALLYAQLRLIGQITTEDLMNFRQYKSVTPGHPEVDMTNGVESTSGPLGQGIAIAVGIAVSEAHLSSKFNEINHYTYAICGDGDLQEGVSYEAMSFAGLQKLNKLIILHDSNDIQLDTAVDKVFKENLKLRMESMDWNYILVKQNNADDIDKAIIEAKKSDKPTFIEVKTVIGEGSTNAGTSSVHGAPLGDDIENVKKFLGWEGNEFDIDPEVTQLYQDTIYKRGSEAFSKWKASAELTKFLESKEVNINISLDPNQATRVTSGSVIQHLNKNVEQWMGGSADLSGSTKASGGDGVFSPENRIGRNVLFGVREFAMAAMANGMALHSNIRPFVSTFFVFADYLKPALRMSAIMKLPVTYIMTHDSVWVGEDGPTHEPIEQLALVRSIPNVNVIRPADEDEVIGAYELAINSTDKPTVIALTRQNIESLDQTDNEKVKEGVYSILDNSSEWTLIAAGSDLANAFKVGTELNLNVYSMSNFKGEPTWDRSKAIVIETGSSFGLHKYANHIIAIDTFGESAPGAEVVKHFGLDYDSILSKVKSIIG